MVIRGVVFDLDDTLYLERAYVESGFTAVSRRLAEISARPMAECHARLTQVASDTSFRGRVFDEVLRRDPALAARVTVRDLVETYRSHEPTISLLPGAVDLLEGLRQSGLKLGMITDGPVASQRAKLTALGLSGTMDPTIVTDAWGIEFRKPHERAFERVEELWGYFGEQLVYIGDNPLKDFVAPRRRGWLSVRLVHTDQLHMREQPADVEASPSESVYGFAEAARVLASWQ